MLVVSIFMFESEAASKTFCFRAAICSADASAVSPIRVSLLSRLIISFVAAPTESDTPSAPAAVPRPEKALSMPLTAKAAFDANVSTPEPAFFIP